MNSISELPTFQACVLQARAYRTLRLFMSSQLKKYNLTMMEWVLLGISNSNTDGYTTTELSEILDVGLPLVTNMVDRVSDMGLVKRVRDTKDARTKRIFATAAGSALAEKVEYTLRTTMKDWLYDVDRQVLTGYIKTMAILASKDPLKIK